jgi:glycosyltransferase involved in cell wall biosynthesis
MKILVHDYSGHPFQVQLSRELARRGHRVLHVYSGSFQTPKGNLERGSDDPAGLQIRPVSVSGEFDKHGLVRRWAQEVQIGRLVSRELDRFRPDLVLSGNAPLDTQQVILGQARRMGSAFVFWLQDIYSEAIERLLPKRLPVLGSVVAARYTRLENSLLRQADHVVPITSDFVAPLLGRGVSPERVTVIENWAPLDQMAPLPRNNPWARRNMGEGGTRVVYSGTLGLKHDPQLLIEIARGIDGHVHVFSEGQFAQRLAEAARAEGLDNLAVEGWVPFADLPAMLSGADIFMAMIEEDAGMFSVPSKVLSYLCIGRPIVASIPAGNLARRIIEREGAGMVFDPGDASGVVEAIRRLAADPGLRRTMGASGRAYAERAFDIEAIGDAFERVVHMSVKRESERLWGRDRLVELR